MIEALNQDHQRLKLLLRCEENDPLYSKKQRKVKDELVDLLEQEACVVKEIANVMEQLRRDQLVVSGKEKKMLEHRIRFSGFFQVIKTRFQRLRYLQDLEYKKYQTAVQLNLSSVSNKRVRHEIDDIKATRQKYELSFKKVLDNIESIKHEKTHLLDEASNCVEDKDTAESMIKAILNRNKKEDDLYQQKIENMKQMIRYDTKATDFLVRKLNERTELKAIEEVNRQEELKETLEAESAALAKQKEGLEAIQDVTDEKDDVFMVHAYNQREADKIALFNYIADLNGELAHLKQQQTGLSKEIESLELDNRFMSDNFNQTMSENEIAYKMLTKELERCDRETVELNKTMDRIKRFIECTFMKLGGSIKSMEDTLGLDLAINPGNMSVYLKDIETMVCRVIHTYHYTKKFNSLLKSKEETNESLGPEVIKQAMKTFQPPVPIIEDQESYKSIYVPAYAIPNPVKEAGTVNFFESMVHSGGPSRSPDDAFVGVLPRDELVILAKRNVEGRSGIGQRSRIIKF